MSTKKNSPKKPTDKPAADQLVEQAAAASADAEAVVEQTPATTTDAETVVEQTTADTAAQPPAAGRLRVRAPHPRRRAGLAFGPVPVELNLADLSEAQIAALNADPLLQIQPIEPEAE